MDYNNRTFVGVTNYDTGKDGRKATFHYRQKDSVVWGTYSGGVYEMGNLIAKVNEDGSLDMHWHCIDTMGVLKAGVCRSVPTILPDGRIQLHETWDGSDGPGTSVIEEVKVM